mmetsp:Transcript_12464/g.30469  ORF Transcript_12464/g.30469 Transcript_12464/m.30469 type:complete len:240 (-) Transcript_12464:15-734(-)
MPRSPWLRRSCAIPIPMATTVPSSRVLLLFRIRVFVPYRGDSHYFLFFAVSRRRSHRGIHRNSLLLLLRDHPFDIYRIGYPVRWTLCRRRNRLRLRVRHRDRCNHFRHDVSYPPRRSSRRASQCHHPPLWRNNSFLCRHHHPSGYYYYCHHHRSKYCRYRPSQDPLPLFFLLERDSTNPTTVSWHPPRRTPALRIHATRASPSWCRTVRTTGTASPRHRRCRYRRYQYCSSCERQAMPS